MLCIQRAGTWLKQVSKLGQSVHIANVRTGPQICFHFSDTSYGEVEGGMSDNFQNSVKHTLKNIIQRKESVF